MNDRVEEERVLLKQNYSNVRYKFAQNTHWFWIGDYLLPPNFSPNAIQTAFSVTVGHPIPKPYGFFVENGIKYKDQQLSLKAPPHPPPFEGSWIFCSWDPVNWKPGTNVVNGDNLFGWVRSFREGIIQCGNLPI